MRKFFYLPTLILIALGGLLASLIGWETAEDWLAEKYAELWEHCQ